MLIDRQVQRDLLERLSQEYPYTYDFETDYPIDSPYREKVIANLYYLQSHGLITEKSIFVSKSIGAKNRIQFGIAEITHKGIDFLQDDGGLSAILNVVTIKFEADTLKSIIENRINQSIDLSPDEKKSMIDSLRELPAESIKHLTTKLLDEGLENLPSAILLIGTYLGFS